MVTVRLWGTALLAAVCLAAATQAAEPRTPLALSGPAGVTPISISRTGGGGTQDLPLLPARPPLPKLEKPAPWEYFTVVTLLSAPFTVLWCGLVAVVAESIAQHGAIPPKFSSSTYIAVGIAAGASSLGIGLFSISWGNSTKTASPASEPDQPLVKAKLEATHD